MAKIIDLKNEQAVNPLIQHSAFNGWPMVIGWAAMLIFAIHACTHMVAAGDTWVAMACGRHFVNQAEVHKTILPFYVDTNEPFSANSHKPGPTKDTMAKYASVLRQEALREEARGEKGIKVSLMKWYADRADNFENWPDWLKRFAKWIHPTGWIDQNWLTHVIFYELVPKSTYTPSDTFTSNALVYWKFAVYILIVICVYYTTRLLGVNPALAAVFTCFAIFTGRSYFDVRPAGFSNLLVAVYLLILVLATYRNILYIWLIVPVMVFWCNLHGGYLYVFIMLVPFVGLHLLALFPKKWTLTCYAIALWLALDVMSRRFVAELNSMSRDIFNKPSLFALPAVTSDSLFYLVLVLIAIGIVVTIYAKLNRDLFFGFHITALLIMFLAVLARYFPQTPYELRMCPEVIKEQFSQHISSSRLFFLLIFVILTAVGIALSFFKKSLVSLSLRGLVHTVLAGTVSFVAMIIFNPFHLTNLTHTFAISISKHAEMWRTVNEWHPAFEWSNPVGTSYPFLVMFILGILILAFWLAAHFLIPKLNKIQKVDIEEQGRKFNLLLTAFGFLAAVFIFWVTLISFSFINYDLASFIFAALFMAVILAAMYKSIYLIYLFPLFVLLALWTSYPKFLEESLWFKEIHIPFQGRYIYPYILLPGFFAVSLIASRFCSKIKIRPLNIIHVFLSAFVSLVLMVCIFNPFRIDWSAGNYSPVGIVKSIFHAVVLFMPAYVKNAEPGYSNLFRTLYVINVLSVVVWLAVPYLRGYLLQFLGDDTRPFQSEERAEQYQLPKTDIGLVVIAALTIYMAVKMRRFIPIAAIVACPILAMFLDRTIRIIAASMNFYRVKRFFVLPMPKYLETFFIISAAAVTSFLGVYWAMRFKYVYLDSWPTDDKLTSVFMRMTASDAKPFYALKFIKDNKISGKMFNYWTEGGFIAWGQQPDPNTGKTPLQLFMDGRAQAAYEPKAYYRWSDIMFGGPEVKMAREIRTVPNYIKVGNWIDEQLTSENVWIILMPIAEFDSDFVRGLQTSGNWMILYYDNEQKIFMDRHNPNAVRLFDGIFNGSTVYPNEFSKNLILSYYKLSSPDPNERNQGFDCAVKALNEYPVQVSIERVTYAARYPNLKPSVDLVCKNYYDDFIKNKEEYKKQNAYHDRVVAAMYAADYLRELAERAKDTELMNNLIKQINELKTERELLVESKRW